MTRIPPLKPRIGHLLAGAAVLVLCLPGVAAATHGSWTHHHLVVFESGTSNYGGYANVGASNRVDFLYARNTVYYAGSSSPVRDESVMCSASCPPRSTATVYWQQTRSTSYSSACARRGSHVLPGSAADPNCSSRGLPAHAHVANLS